MNLECSRNTVAKVIAKADELNIRWPLTEGITDGELDKKFFPKSTPLVRILPDLEYLHKE